MGIQMTIRQTPILAAALLVLGACKARDGNLADTAVARIDTGMSRAGAAVDTAVRRVDSAAGSLVKRAGWTSASTLGFVGAANDGEIREGELAVRKATNRAVKAFARQLVADHRAMMSDAKALGSKLNVTPDTTSDDVRDLVKHAADDIKDLTDKPAGLDWDKEYIDKQINGHKDVLDKLQDSAKNTTDPELRAALEKATGKVQEHLTKAQDIKDNALKNDTTSNAPKR
jgi:putative membrane protein